MNKPVKNSEVKSEVAVAKEVDPKDCFVIMPISEVEGYEPNHFRHVYNNIIKVACNESGYRAIRADDVQASNFIHLDILRKTIESPLAICDLSTRNPNVLFELGVRQAFDLPVVLIQEKGTPKIFDIGPLRCLEYDKEMRYHDVLEAQKKLSEAINETVKASSDSGNVNSIVRLLSLADSAKIPDVSGDRDSMSLDIVRSEMHQIRKAFEQFIGSKDNFSRTRHPISVEYERVLRNLNLLMEDDTLTHNAKMAAVSGLMEDITRAIRHAEGRNEQIGLKILLERAEAYQKRLARDYDEMPF